MEAAANSFPLNGPKSFGLLQMLEQLQPDVQNLNHTAPQRIRHIQEGQWYRKPLHRTSVEVQLVAIEGVIRMNAKEKGRESV
jgi:hypothetical protein